MLIFEWIKVLILGIVEGITEWLPISSTGHMILVDEFLHLNVTPQFLEMFLVVIQLGAIMAVVVLYFNKLNPFGRKKTYLQKRDTLSLWGKVLVACIPAGILGALFNEQIDKWFYNYKVVAITLIVYGILFIVIENYNKRRRPRVSDFEHLNFRTVLWIGVFQVLSLIPGTSRSGATILGAILLGTSRNIAAEFSFFLSIPVMFGASLVKLLDFGFNFTQTELMMLIFGVVVAFVVSILAIKFLITYIQRHDFKAFGYYRIVLGVLVLAYFMFFAS